MTGGQGEAQRHGEVRGRVLARRLRRQDGGLQQHRDALIGKTQAGSALTILGDRAVISWKVYSARIQSWLMRSTARSRRLAAKPMWRSLGRLCGRLPLPKSQVLLMAVSVRSARFSLRYIRSISSTGSFTCWPSNAQRYHRPRSGRVLLPPTRRLSPPAVLPEAGYTKARHEPAIGVKTTTGNIGLRQSLVRANCRKEAMRHFPRSSEATSNDEPSPAQSLRP